MQRRKFSREYKIEAVKLVRERGVSAVPAAAYTAETAELISTVGRTCNV